ncbi:MAG TPA: glycosyltransferase family 2 protein [Allocoleopsis sp.]
MLISEKNTQTNNLITAENPSEIQVSIIAPVYNEIESIPHLLTAISSVMIAHNITYEILCIDDGSTDGSTQLLKELALTHNDLKAVLLRRNYGQTAAMAAGFNYAEGKIIITLDADLQNDPQDIPKLLEKIAEGYDLVSGWRKNRQDNKLSRLIPSKLANLLISKVTEVKLNDYGCSLKAYSAEVVKDMNLYGELHRFLPALAYIEGAKITEIPVNHYARKYGKSKYGLDRTFRVLMDLLTIWFMKTFLTRPMHVFGMMGLLCMLSGTGVGIYLTFIKLYLGESIGHRPLLILVVVLLLTGVQLFSFGLLAELLMRTYHESQNRPIYRVREVVKNN